MTRAMKKPPMRTIVKQRGPADWTVLMLFAGNRVLHGGFPSRRLARKLAAEMRESWKRHAA